MAGVASVLLDTGRLDEAEDLLRKALAIDRAAVGEEGVETALALTGLAEVYVKRRDTARAEPLLRRALAGYEKAGTHHADMATAYHELGTLYIFDHRYGQAEDCFLRALALLEKAFDSSHPTLAVTQANLAMAYVSDGQLEKAVPIFENAVALIEHNFGPDHPHLATMLRNGAEMYRRQRDYNRAVPMLKRSMQIAERLYGPDSPDLVPWLKAWSSLLRETHASAEANKVDVRLKSLLATR
jgi:tetratricopeptide (TPR) repeat protein